MDRAHQARSALIGVDVDRRPDGRAACRGTRTSTTSCECRCGCPRRRAIAAECCDWHRAGERSGARRSGPVPRERAPRSRRAHTVEVPGGTQALHRSQRVEVEVGDVRGSVPRPNLLGAILLKARAVDVDDAPENQRVTRLAPGLVPDPNLIVKELGKHGRSWIARRREMDDRDAARWRGLSTPPARAGLATLRVVAGW